MRPHQSVLCDMTSRVCVYPWSTLSFQNARLFLILWLKSNLQLAHSAANFILFPHLFNTPPVCECHRYYEEHKFDSSFKLRFSIVLHESEHWTHWNVAFLCVFALELHTTWTELNSLAFQLNTHFNRMRASLFSAAFHPVSNSIVVNRNKVAQNRSHWCKNQRAKVYCICSMNSFNELFHWFDSSEWHFQMTL